jgi:hypothetical protein
MKKYTLLTFLFVCLLQLHAQTEVWEYGSHSEKWLSFDINYSMLAPDPIMDGNLSELWGGFGASNHLFIFWDQFDLGFFEHTYVLMGTGPVLHDGLINSYLQLEAGVALGPVWRIRHNHASFTYYAVGLDVKFMHGKFEKTYAVYNGKIQYEFNGLTLGTTIDVGWRYLFNQYVSIHLGLNTSFDLINIAGLDDPIQTSNHTINYGWVGIKPYIGVGITWMTDKSVATEFGDELYWIDW